MTVSPNPLFTNNLLASREDIRRNWGWVLALGIFFVIGGLCAISAATFTTLFSVAFLGSLLFISGIAKILYTLWVRKWSGFFLSLLSGALYMLVGGAILLHPASAAIALTLLMAVMFIATGLIRLFSPLYVRFEGSYWMALSGLISIILGGMILAEWPASGLWILGLFLGIDMIFYGWTWVFVALAVRSNSNNPAVR
jgi:uncharacterized membrane protein HdeD (DUF308 family)